MKLKEITCLNYYIGEDLAFCKKDLLYWHNSDGPAYMDSTGILEWWVENACIKTEGPGYRL